MTDTLGAPVNPRTGVAAGALSTGVSSIGACWMGVSWDGASATAGCSALTLSCCAGAGDDVGDEAFFY